MTFLDNLLQTRNSRLCYYATQLWKYYYPKRFLKLDYEKFKPALELYGEELARERLDYYNRIDFSFAADEKSRRLKDFSLKDPATMYLLDLMEYARYFPQDARVLTLFLDVIHVPDAPTIVKSRPVTANANSVIFNMNKLRHLLFLNDTTPFREKKDKLVWRGACYQPHRIAFIEQFFGKSDLLDVGQYNRNATPNPQWQRPFMTIREQLGYKFILTIEGNDVATSTKWAMSSNSLVFMPKPKYETWFMEGRLRPDYHFVLVNDDYSNLESLVEYYIDHPDEAEEIIHNAHNYIQLFKTPLVEDWLCLQVLQRYLQYSGQL